MKKVLFILSLIIIFVVMFFCGMKFATYLDENEEKDILDKQEILEEKTNIIKHGEINTRGLFELPSGDASPENDLMINDMTWDSDSRLYYKVIKDEKDYNKYNNRIEIPTLDEIDLENNYLIITANENVREADEVDLLIYNITEKENATEIILKQKENPSPYSEKNVFWAVVDKDLIKEDIDVKIVHD